MVQSTGFTHVVGTRVGLLMGKKELWSRKVNKAKAIIGIPMNLCCPPVCLQYIETWKVKSALLANVVLWRSILMSNSGVRGIEKEVASCVILPLMDFIPLPMSYELCGSGAVETTRNAEGMLPWRGFFVFEHFLGVREMDITSCIVSVPVSRCIGIMQNQIFGSGIVFLALGAIGVLM